MDRAALSYGYNLNITTIQLAQAYSVFANEGVLQPLTLLSEGVTSKPVRVFKKETVRKSPTDCSARRLKRVGQLVVLRYRCTTSGKIGTTMKYAMVLVRAVSIFREFCRPCPNRQS